MPDYRKFYEKQYLGAWDLSDENGNPRDVVLTIKECTQGAIPAPGTSKTEKRPVLSFAKTEKKMVLNVTNGKTISSLYGNEVNNWRGKKICLFGTTTTKGRETVDCIRVRPFVPPDRPTGATGKAPAVPANASADAPPIMEPPEMETAPLEAQEGQE